jgi:ADP-heptose:LPS heptosyltransferase
VYNDINKYQGVYYLELLHKIKPNVVNFNDLKLDINISSLSKSKVDDWIIQQNIHKFAIVVNSGGNNAFESNGVRMMPFDKTTSLLQELSKKYEKILLVGGSVDVDSYNRYVYKLENIDNVLNVAGYFTLSESAYLISLSEMAYITDCGALHLAIASGCNKNMIAIFSATNPNHFMPKELLQRAYWQDEDVYTDRYSLYGNKKIKHHKYFTKLKIRDLIDFDCVK